MIPGSSTVFGQALSLVLTGLLAGTPIAAQDVPPSAANERAGTVTDVLLDVLVTDSDGARVRGLGPEDFIVEDDHAGRVDVDDVTFVTVEATGNTPSADRYFVLFFHDVRRIDEPDRRLLRRQMRAGLEAREWVRSGLRPDDWVAVANWDARLRVYQDFTRDVETLDRAIDDAMTGAEPAKVWPSRRADDPSARPSLLHHLPSGNELRDATTRLEDALRVLAEATEGIVGRKNLLLFTIGFGEISPGFLSRPDQRFYPAMERSLNDHNVAVYPIDLTPPHQNHLQSHFLQRLADDTGGRYWDRFPGFSAPLEAIAEETEAVYLLSIRTRQPPDESGYREVEVRTVDPEYRVRGRGGYRYGD